jgi:hypothetical protein
VVDIGERTPCPVTVLHDDIGMLRIAAILKALNHDKGKMENRCHG